MIPLMVRIGEFNKLPIVRESPYGLYLDGGDMGEILLPESQVPVGVMHYHDLEVFIFRDTGERLIAFTRTPYVMVGKFAYLEVVDLNERLGAFLDWGLPKNLLLPFREQETRVRMGQGVIVTMYLDPETDRLVATSKIRKYLNKTPAVYEPNEAVDLVVMDETDLGFNAIVNDQHIGLLYHTELAEALNYGDTMRGYVAKVREDGKIDLRRDPSGYERKDSMAEQVYSILEKEGGTMPFNDKSSPASIRETFNSSKKAFKMAIGTLYRERRIVISDKGIEINKNTEA